MNCPPIVIPLVVLDDTYRISRQSSFPLDGSRADRFGIGTQSIVIDTSFLTNTKDKGTSIMEVYLLPPVGSIPMVKAPLDRDLTAASEKLTQPLEAKMEQAAFAYPGNSAAFTCG